MPASHGNPLGLLADKLDLHAPLSDADRNAIMNLPFGLRTLEAADYVVREGEPPVECAILVTGFACRHKLTSGGRRQIISLHIPGEPLDFQHLFLGTADHNIQMVTQGEVALVPRGAFRALVHSNPSVATAIIASILVEGSMFREWLLNLGQRDARSRMAHVLCEFAMRMQAHGLEIGDEYELPINQEQFGDALGLSTVHVNRTLKLLEADGLIVRTKRHIAFPSWERIRRAGDFNERYLHLRDRHPNKKRVGTPG